MPVVQVVWCPVRPSRLFCMESLHLRAEDCQIYTGMVVSGSSRFSTNEDRARERPLTLRTAELHHLRYGTVLSRLIVLVGGIGGATFEKKRWSGELVRPAAPLVNAVSELVRGLSWPSDGGVASAARHETVLSEHIVLTHDEQDFH